MLTQWRRRPRNQTLATQRGAGAPARERSAPADARRTAGPGAGAIPPAAGVGAVDTHATSRGRRRGLGWHGRNAGAATVGAVGSGVMALASFVLLAAVLIALLIALAILCVDLSANAGNTIVKGIHEGANFFASPFTGLIQFNGHPKRAVTVDWGIAVLVYLIAGFLISRWIARVGRGGVRFERAHRPAV
jgi:hypothetical protein